MSRIEQGQNNNFNRKAVHDGVDYHLEIYHLNLDRINIAKGGPKQEGGIFQVDIFGPLNVLNGAITALAGQVLENYDEGQEYDYNGTEVYIGIADDRTPVTDDGFNKLTLSIAWFIYN